MSRWPNGTALSCPVGGWRAEFALPESLTGYTVMSMDLKTSMDKLVALAKTFKPDAEEQVNQAIDAIKTKTKLRLREDILSHLGRNGGVCHLGGM